MQRAAAERIAIWTHAFSPAVDLIRRLLPWPLLAPILDRHYTSDGSRLVGKGGNSSSSSSSSPSSSSSSLASSLASRSSSNGSTAPYDPQVSFISIYSVTEYLIELMTTLHDFILAPNSGPSRMGAPRYPRQARPWCWN